MQLKLLNCKLRYFEPARLAAAQDALAAAFGISTYVAAKARQTGRAVIAWIFRGHPI